MLAPSPELRYLAPRNYWCFARYCAAPLATHDHLWFQDDDLLLTPEQFGTVEAHYRRGRHRLQPFAAAQARRRRRGTDRGPGHVRRRRPAPGARAPGARQAAVERYSRWCGGDPVEPARARLEAELAGTRARLAALGDFFERFAHCHVTGLDLLLTEPLESWPPFDLLLERDGGRQQHAVAEVAIARLLASRELAVVSRSTIPGCRRSGTRPGFEPRPKSSRCSRGWTR